MEIIDIAVVGGGAAGLMAAISAATECKNNNINCKVVVLEGNPKVGKKLLATGNGRCNLSNNNIAPQRYFGDVNLASELFEKYSCEFVLNQFKSMGLLTLADSEGRVYPYNKQASAVVDVLSHRCEELGVDCILEFNCFSIIKSGCYFVLKSSDGRELKARKCILSTGGLASPKHSSSHDGYEILKNLGHTVTKTYPALVQLRTDDKFIKTLSGVRSSASVKLYFGEKLLTKESGEILFADKSLSGICIFQLSVVASKIISDDISHRNQGGKLYLSIDLASDFSENQLFDFLKNYKLASPGLLSGDFLSGILNIKLGREIIRSCKVDTLSEVKNLSDKDIRNICSKIKNLNINITGTKGFDDAQITGGGIPLSEVDTNTFESCKVNGLYICGELLNIHGECGGYNLYLAWTTGFVAGKSSAQ